MPGPYTYPGVYVEEIPSGVRPITGVSTSNTAFIGFFPRGPMNDPVRITSFSDFVRNFGDLDSRSEAGYAIQQYYTNGGQVAFVVRVAAGTPQPAVLNLFTGDSVPQVALGVAAASEGEWGKKVQVAIGHISGVADRFNMVVREVDTVSGPKQVINSEIFRNLSMGSSDANYVHETVNDQSNLVKITQVGGGPLPEPTDPSVDDITAVTIVADPSSSAFRQLGSDTRLPAASDGTPPTSTELIAGLNKLDDITPEIFNILCIPAAANLDPKGFGALYATATTYCAGKRAFLIIDIPQGVRTQAEMSKWMTGQGDNLRHENAAVYFPRLRIPDQNAGGRLRNVGPSGTLAGVYARTDSTRGVWKAPAGTEASLVNAQVTTKLTDLENGALNPLGVNVLRNFPVYGNISWGGRTLNGADQMASEWKYIPVRRTALFIEESLYSALKWVVFEPNDEPLWAQIRLNVGAFMHNLFRQGAFQGKTPREAYFVKCDKETTTQNDIDRGIVNIVVGFAPLKPAEFVVIKIQQIAGQIEV